MEDRALSQTGKTPTNNTSLSLTPINPSRKPAQCPLSPKIPPDSVLIADAEALLNASRSWQPGRKTHPSAKTFLHKERVPGSRSKRKSQVWQCIVSELHRNEISFNAIWAKIGRNKVWNQKSYATNIAKVTRIKYFSESQSIWTVSIGYPPPMSPRVFTVYQTSALLEYSHRRRGIVITLPIDLSSRSNDNFAELEEKGVKGRIASVEHLQEVDGDIIEWRRVICIDSGGSIPRCWARRHAEKKVIDENARCIAWLKNLKQEEPHEDRQEEFPQRGSIGSLNMKSAKASIEMLHYQNNVTNTETIVG